ncbi:hypothetical protein CBOM_00938 [Ceraceosorus bombacis]|uniref:Uncharacterized protein n=1 Tax=Ceraceosorus bombacis TaxID=401625 RepID=A0A0P1BCF1_9BASI|nr:hypothetical protein CBOM_00938 [Ceraceosorus bombacis]
MPQSIVEAEIPKSFLGKVYHAVANKLVMGKPTPEMAGVYKGVAPEDDLYPRGELARANTLAMPQSIVEAEIPKSLLGKVYHAVANKLVMGKPTPEMAGVYKGVPHVLWKPIDGGWYVGDKKMTEAEALADEQAYLAEKKAGKAQKKKTTAKV